MIFKFQSDSINTRWGKEGTVTYISTLNSNLILLIREGKQMGTVSDKAFKFQSDSINTPCSKTPLKPQVTTLISVDLRNKHLYALTS